MHPYPMLIGGEFVAGDRKLEVVNPATEEVFVTSGAASEAQFIQAIAAAKAAFPAWSVSTMDERRALLVKLADGMEARVDEMARLLTSEQGKPLPEATGEIQYAIGFIRYFATLDLPVEVIEDSDTRRVEAHRKPLGVVGAIVPWNFPILIVAFKLPLALLAGNTVVLKPAATTPLTTLLLGEICKDIFPAGVVNVVADLNDLGGLLSSHPDVAKISFTGSTETGRKVMSAAAATIKRITLELGGNDAAIVLEDADPKKAAAGIYAGAFFNAGQVCIALKRAYVHEGIYDALCDELAQLANAAVVDDGLKQGATIGPIQNKVQYDKVLEFLADAHDSGTVIAGGNALERAGYFVQPTIVRDISDGTKLVDEEQFGPILPVIKYSDPLDALARANASPYGLGASVWGTDVTKAYEIAQQMEAGTVWINQHLNFGPNIPFGGAKQSGLGTEFADEGLHEFTQLRVVNMAK
ncbi:aldehyde dehydrogenase family protein [Sphingomonas naphthae]|uniref:Aldehyde dehydrogenase family protein n=2 Tax=Sphingomonas naphthae TaxID=1813468 RepID=A0ABY7TMG5_9SPHN|nr:aldehyde dehydrogenase family protein [Sphingomonas naphthae]WCT74145.1 aldehyde dehydrogenase family protein [Sphingomonas naphthae]